MTLNQRTLAHGFLFLTGVCGILLWYLACHTTDPVVPDSASYLHFSTQRPMGYPAFLWGVQRLLGGLSFLPILQLLLIGLSTLYFVTQFYDMTKRFLLSLLLLAGCLCNPNIYHAFRIMTEGVSLALVTLFLGVFINTLVHPKKASLLMLSSLVGVAILMRPVHYAFVPLLLLLIPLYRHLYAWSFKVLFLNLLAPLILLLLLGGTGQYIKHGFFALENMSGFNMIGKVALIADKEIPSRHPALLNEVARFSAPVQTYIHQAPSLSLQFLLSSPYYDYFRYNTLSTKSYSDTLYQQTALDIIKARPVAYLKDVWMNYCALWQVYELLTSSERTQFKEFLNTHQAPYMPPTWEPETLLLSIELPTPVIWLLRLGLVLVALSGIGFVIAALRKSPSPMILTGAMAALVVQGHYLLIALSQAGLPRYGFALWSPIVLGGIMILVLANRTEKKTYEYTKFKYRRFAALL